MIDIPKNALRRPMNWVHTLISAGCDTDLAHRAQERAATLMPLAERLGRLKQDRRRTSRAIGDAKARAIDTTSLMTRMRDISAESRALENELREALTDIADMLAAAENDGGPAPDDARRSEVRDGMPNAVAPAYFESPAQADGRPAIEDASTLLVRTDFDAAEYAHYVRSHPARTAYHELRLRDLIAETLGQRSHHLLARDAGGAVRGVLPLVQLRSRLFGNYLVSMPWFNYGGPLADDDVVASVLMDASADLAREAGCSHAEIRETRPRAGWTARTHKVSMTLALPTDVSTFERALGASLRAQSRKAERAGCTFRTGGRELLDDFYRVFSTNMRDLGTPVQSRAFFEGLLELFGDDAFLAVVSHGSTPLAVGFLLGHGDTLEIPWASSLRRANPLDVNMLLYRRTLGEAIERGYRVFDFGRSSPGGPTWRFKKQWGAVPRQLYWHYWTASGEPVTGPTQDSPRYRLATDIWKRLPVPLTRVIGPPIVRGLP